MTKSHEYGADDVLGIYLTEKAAKEAWKGKWTPYDYTKTIQYNGDLRLWPRKFSKRGLNAVQKLAFDILRSDPMALDAARDILKC